MSKSAVLSPSYDDDMIYFSKYILITEIYRKTEITAKMVLMDRLHAFPTLKVIHKLIKLESSRCKHKGNAPALNVNKGVLMDRWSM